ncbi:UvrD-helicase domain-containing protein [Formosa sp. A9]|uniref:UvrD-helicase domain-containing protein n=1 Tax=Formosa sp. A9 TaxID=3442641 RepID=UPI003EBDB3BA
MKPSIVFILSTKLFNMQNQTSFTIYDASAGSGKTFTLVKSYLKILFESDSYFQFKNILAITFTNKAVFEMKERIIKTLKAFADPTILKEEHTMFNLLCAELNMQPEALHSKSQTLLNTIVHNYAAFEISTIDGFTHRIIRTFAHDLKLPLNFEVELDTDALLTEAVDRLIAKAGTDQTLTDVLVQFALEKADDDKSWDIALDLNKIAKLLVNENDIIYLDTLKDKNLDDFKALKTHLKSEIQSTKKTIISKAKDLLTVFENHNLSAKDFSRGTLYNHFVKVSDFNIDKIYENQLENNINDGKVYTKTLARDKAASIDALLPSIKNTFLSIKSQVYHFKFLNTVYKNITQLSVLNTINKELTLLKTEENKMLISEFNTLISNQVSEQPTPFIYERLGEKFNHYFIDEFQDTSQLQWQNLIPLISEGLDTIDTHKTPGSLMLVGDAKQAIYRWRGGKAEQFIELCENAFNFNPFHTPKEVYRLETNFRSFKHIINFNNSFFKYLTKAAFSNVVYKGLYENAQQELSNPNDGFVNITFLDLKEEDKDELYPKQVLKTIESCIKNGYNYKDICVLVRKRKEAAVIADYLSLHDIQIISSESLLLKKSPEVMFVTQLISLLFEPKNNEIKVDILNYIATKYNVEDKHAYFAEHIQKNNTALFQSFSTFGIFSQAHQLIQMPLFDMAETIIRQFQLTKTSNAYLQYYLDIVLDYTQKHGSDVFGFLEYFNNKLDVLSIVSPEGQDAIQIMTIHKSKGLEFPVVIFPYADLDIYREKEPKTWFPLDQDQYKGFPYTLINYNADVAEYNEAGQEIYMTHQAELELDNLNLLYVTLTRPVEQLYIISSLDLDTKKLPKTKQYSGLFIDFLMQEQLWNDQTLSYNFGTPERPTSITNETEQHANTNEIIEFISTPKNEHNIKIVTNNGYLWDTKQQNAIEKGNLVHNLMAKISTKKDVPTVLEQANRTGLISTEQQTALNQTITQIILHPELEPYFNETYTIYTERDILAKDGTILRPDRLAISTDHEVVIIDYKTGLELEQHKQQLLNYQQHLEQMQYKVTKKLLVYINDELLVKSI